MGNSAVKKLYNSKIRIFKSKDVFRRELNIKHLGNMHQYMICIVMHRVSTNYNKIRARICK